MKKTIISVILTISLLFSFTAFVSAENTLKPNASNNISSEVSEKLKENIDYDHAIRIYTVGMYCHDFVDGKTLDEIVNTFSDSAEMYFAIKISLNEFEYGTYSYKDGEMRKIEETDTEALKKYEWLKDTFDAKTISIEGIGDKPITNVYCMHSYSPPRGAFIVYQTLDATYYALYDKGMDEEPVYVSEDTFMKYANAYVEEYNSHPKYDESGYPLNFDISVPFDSLGLETLNVKLSSKAIVDNETFETAVNNYVTDDEKKDDLIKIITAVSSVVVVSLVAVIAVFAIKNQKTKSS